ASFVLLVTIDQISGDPDMCRQPARKSLVRIPGRQEVRKTLSVPPCTKRVAPTRSLVVEPEVPVRHAALDLLDPAANPFGVVTCQRGVADLDGRDLRIDVALELFPQGVTRV